MTNLHLSMGLISAVSGKQRQMLVCDADVPLTLVGHENVHFILDMTNLHYR